MSIWLAMCLSSHWDGGVSRAMHKDSACKHGSSHLCEHLVAWGWGGNVQVSR